MQSTPKVLQEWSVHAEVTFSHGAQTPTAQLSGSNVSMDCSWQKPTTTSSASTTLRPCYGFQRGNILFTTTPPRSSQHDVIRQSSGGSQSAKASQHPYDRRCKSTCSIVLANPGEKLQSFHYHCGDRACYHARPPYTSGFSTIPENCEICNINQVPDCHNRKSSTFTTHFCTRVPERSANKERQDAASQTDTGHNVVPENLQVPDVPLQKKKLSKRLSRSPARLSGKSPLLQRRYSEVSQGTSSRSSTPDVDCNKQCQGKPRTVHIDVYCTGSEDADASASSDADTTDESSPQTVFESEQLRVMHTKMGKFSLPKGLKQVPRRSESLKEKSNVNYCLEPKGYESDDVLSSQYPSRLSSYTSLKESASGLVSEQSSTVRDPSWSTISSCAISCDDKDSVMSTSWKDVSTELDSAAVSSSSFVNKFDPYLTQSDSFEYADMTDRIRIKEKAMAWADEGNAQQPHDIEKKRLHQQQKFKEFLYRHLGKGTFPLWKSQHSDDSEEDEDNDDDDDDDDTGDAWSFIGRGCSGTSLRRENTVKKVAKSTTPSEGADIKSLTLPLRINHLICDAGSLSDSGPPSVNRFARRIAIGPFGSKPPSPPPLKVESSVVSPFTSVQGTGTDQLSKAQKFGTIVGTLKKPGNHIGPSKNPYCSCAHCRSFYEATLHCGRARSVGDINFHPETGQPNECNAQNMHDTKFATDNKKYSETESVKSNIIADASESDGTPV
ncbi:uncharacterized protein LOC126481252 [Schistocerca serialis cubense]|uniref:uncharacterized protein LOC126481252 n=1 Tax=Schistocerca serialis cubense TaxID=2023355 RepID=UPI00214F2DB2|nr:uncharacterized protein LOC126481252 [Schistocerca serialis cubense]